MPTGSIWRRKYIITKIDTPKSIAITESASTIFLAQFLNDNNPKPITIDKTANSVITVKLIE